MRSVEQVTLGYEQQNHIYDYEAVMTCNVGNDSLRVWLESGRRVQIFTKVD